MSLNLDSNHVRTLMLVGKGVTNLVADVAAVAVFCCRFNATAADAVAAVSAVLAAIAVLQTQGPGPKPKARPGPGPGSPGPGPWVRVPGLWTWWEIRNRLLF